MGAHLGFWLRFVSNHVSNAFRLKLAEHGVAVAEWALMRELLDAPESPSRLAVRLGLTRGGVTKVVDKLVARGLVARAADPADQRGQVLALTRTGRALVPTLAGLAEANERECFGHLPPETVARLAATLRELVAHHGLRAVPVA